MAKQDSIKSDDTLQKLDEITRLLQDFLILQGLKMRINIEDVRALVQVDKNRVNRISKLLKKSKTLGSAVSE